MDEIKLGNDHKLHCVCRGVQIDHMCSAVKTYKLPLQVDMLPYPIVFGIDIVNITK